MKKELKYCHYSQVLVSSCPVVTAEIQKDPFKKIIKEWHCKQVTAQMYYNRIYTQGFRLTVAQLKINI